MTHKNHLRPHAIVIAGLSAVTLAVTGCAQVASGGANAEGTPASTSTTSTCEPSLAPGLNTVSVVFDGIEYPVSVTMPQSGAPRGLILDLHGSSSNAQQQAEVSGLGAHSDAANVIVVQADGAIEVPGSVEGEASLAWNVPGVPTTDGEYPPEDARDDIEFLSAVITTISAQGCVEAGDVLATGHSGGGRMTSALACERANLLTAIAPNVALRAGRSTEGDLSAIDTTTCAPSQPVAVLTVHGTEDVVNPYNGNDDPRWGYSVPAGAEHWATLNGCNLTPAMTDAGGSVTSTTYGECEDNATVTMHTIVGANHIWAGTQADQSYFGSTDWEFDTSEAMIDFFLDQLAA